MLAAADDLTDRQIDGELAAVLALARHLAPDADDVPYPRCQVILQVLIVLAAVGFRHQHLDVASYHLIGVIAEHA